MLLMKIFVHVDICYLGKKLYYSYKKYFGQIYWNRSGKRAIFKGFKLIYKNIDFEAEKTFPSLSFAQITETKRSC